MFLFCAQTDDIYIYALQKKEEIINLKKEKLVNIEMNLTFKKPIVDKNVSNKCEMHLLCFNLQKSSYNLLF